jgi:hypothetical protein
MSLLALPRNTSPKEFFEQHVARELARVAVPPGVSAEACAVEVKGGRGGVWTARVEAGRTVVGSGKLDGAFFAVSLSEADFAELMFGSVRDRLVEALGGRDKLERLATPERLARLYMPTSRIDKLRPFKGDMLVAIEDDDEGLTYKIGFGLAGAVPSATSPRTTLTTSVDTWLAMVQGKLQPQQAVVQGKIRITGDMAFPMGVMGSLMAP